jgi:predicted CoA-binding protein
MSPVRWLRLSYWVGAIADGAAAVAMAVPEVGAAVYQMESFEPGAAYRYATRLGASLMLGWTVLLLWADRKPVERRGVLPITVLVIAGLAWAGAYAVSVDLITLPMMVPTWVLQGILAALFLYSYFRSLGTTAEASISEGQIPLADAAAEFLAQERFAVAGVSRSGDSAANYIFKRFRESGREVYAINPNAERVEGEPCYPSLAELPARVDAVLVGTHRDQALEIARQCKAAGVQHVWFHRSIDGGSFTSEAATLCADYGATVIPGGCPMMHLDPVDMGHRCMHLVLDKLGTLPSAVVVGTHAAPGANVGNPD